MNMFTPRRPVKSFQDLEVYQKLLAASVAVAKRGKNQSKIESVRPTEVSSQRTLGSIR